MPGLERTDTEQVADPDVQPADPYHVLRERYLTLVESTLAGTIYEDDPIRTSGVEKYDSVLREYGWDWPSKAFTMIGLKRLRNFRAVVESVIGTDVPGDIMEAGVWRGGAGIMARAVLAAYGVGGRRVILADSFAGLPPPDPATYPADAASVFHEYAELRVPLDQVKRNFAKFGLLDDQVTFVPGWFRDTLPTAPVGRLAVLRLDCDMYESSIQALENLYDKVSINGWIVIDDYEVIPACRTAVHDFLKSRNLRPEIYPIDGVGVFFRKTEPQNGAAESAGSQSPRAAGAVAAAAGAFSPVNVDFVAWREALMAVVRASEAVALANQAARTAQREATLSREQMAAAADRHERELAELRVEVERRDREIAGLREQVIAAQTDAARLRHDVQAIYSSRSWRLGQPYRAIGAALLRVRNGGRSATGHASLSDSSPAGNIPAEDPWSRWPVWVDDNTLLTKRFRFAIAKSRESFDGSARKGVVPLLKDRILLDAYRDVLSRLRPQRILEIGFFEGGMPLFLADMVRPKKVVAIDRLQPSEALDATIAGAGLEDTVVLRGGIAQEDTATLRRIVEEEFVEEPLDLIVDDASHEYEQSRNCFEELFGYLRPGGKYAIEDWGWLHWPGEEWQTAKSPFWNKRAMTNLIFELVMTVGSQHPKIIARIEILSWALVIVTRGEGLSFGERIDLSATRLTSGRRFKPL